MSSHIGRDETRDAILVIPGIMGSELVDTESGETLWGLANASWYCDAWTFGDALDRLAVTDEERSGAHGRITATRLLRVPAFAPFLRGIEPYSKLLAGLRHVTAHPDAVAEFPYDWRLSVAHNARLLADRADQHLRRWRDHSSGSREAELVLVAHSMGGLLARYFTGVLGGQVRATITLGTPFYGSVKAAVILSAGRGGPVPLPRRRLRRLSATLPGVHDLLPSYRCVDEGDSARRLSPADVGALGGDAELAREAFERRALLLDAGGEVHALVGVEQRTAQSLTLRDGTVQAGYYTCESASGGGLSRVDRMGDSTVYRDAAAPAGIRAAPLPLPQRHGAIAKTDEAIAFARAALTGRPLGPPLAGARALCLDLPDIVGVGAPFEVRVTNTDDPRGLACVVERSDPATPVAHPQLSRRDGAVAATVTFGRPGVYRVLVKGGGTSAVSDLVLAVTPDGLAVG